MEQLVILGVSGSIGTQTISVLDKDKEHFDLVGFSVGNRTRIISTLIRKYPRIKGICIKSKAKIKYYSSKYPSIKFFYHDQGLLDLIDYCEPTMVVNALVGFVGLVPTIHSLEKNLKVALANKEALVVGGELVNDLLNKGKGKLYPIDSEHSALWKCLKVDSENVDKLIITASGGAFRRLSREELVNVTKDDALAHPTWKMGAKITIDCATMVNKSFEIIEAHYLFNYPEDKIDVLLHDESYIHSMVLYNDGTYRAEISKPDMRNPIRFAIYEGDIDFKTYSANDYHDFGDYHFHEFNINRYPMVDYAKLVIKNKGTYGAVFNAANEVAVYAFLNNEIPFLAIEKIISRLINTHSNILHPSLKTLIKVDKEIRRKAKEMIERKEI